MIKLAISFGTTRKLVEAIRKLPKVSLVRKYPKYIREAAQVQNVSLFKGVAALNFEHNGRNAYLIHAPKKKITGDALAHEFGHIIAMINKDPFHSIKNIDRDGATALLREQIANRNALAFIKHNAKNKTKDLSQYSERAQQAYKTYLSDLDKATNTTLSIFHGKPIR